MNPSFRFLQILTTSEKFFWTFQASYLKNSYKFLQKNVKFLQSFTKFYLNFQSAKGEYPYPLALYLLQILTNSYEFLQSLHKSQNLHGSRLRRAVATFAGNSTKR